TPGLPVSRPWVAAMNAAACSWRVSTNSMPEARNDSSTSRFSSPGMPKMRSTPSFSRALTRRSEPLGMESAHAGVGGPLLAFCRGAENRMRSSRGKQQWQPHAQQRRQEYRAEDARQPPEVGGGQVAALVIGEPGSGGEGVITPLMPVASAANANLSAGTPLMPKPTARATGSMAVVCAVRLANM